MKKLTLSIMVIISIVLLTSCSQNNYLPFATTNREGKYPVKRNKPINKKPTWTNRQWGHQGS